MRDLKVDGVIFVAVGYGCDTVGGGRCQGVDNLCVPVMDPIKLVEQLQSDSINFKLKGTSKIENTVHL